MSQAATRRLMREYVSMGSEPTPLITAKPEEGNILLWYFLFDGPPDTPYAGGCYMGKMRFPPEYPFAPPSLMMCTPTGRFQTETRICTTMSDFHPKDWSPSWGPRTILLGLLSFLVDDAQTHGSMSTSDEYKRQLARESHEFNRKHPAFVRLFADRLAKTAIAAAPAPQPPAASPCSNGGSVPGAAAAASAVLPARSFWSRFGLGPLPGSVVAAALAVLLAGAARYAPLVLQSFASSHGASAHQGTG